MTNQPIKWVHSFDLDQPAMRSIQQQLREQVQITPYSANIQYAAGVDVAYWKDQGAAAIVVMDVQQKTIVETFCHTGSVWHDYQSGFLAFRELPLFLTAWEKLKTEPDVVFFDGNGLLHPQRMGLATHASFFIQKPTIGIAKNPFIGTYEPPSQQQGAFSFITDQEEVIGAALRTQAHVKPIYVSVGNLLTLQNAIEFAMYFVGTESRIPEITRQPDLLTRIERKKWNAP